MRHLQVISLFGILYGLFAALPLHYAFACDFGTGIGGTNPTVTTNSPESFTPDTARLDGFISNLGSGASQCRGFITAVGDGTFSIPADWSSTNTIEAIGSGGNGNAGASGGPGGTGNGGGGAGAYSKITNQTLSGTVGLHVGGVVGSGDSCTSSTGSGCSTYFCNSNDSNCSLRVGSNNASVILVACGAEAPAGSPGATGGPSSGSCGSGVRGASLGTASKGGGGGAGGGSGANSGSGGGAGGPNGAGNNGVTNGQGGAGDAGNTASTTQATSGNNGTQWSSSPAYGSGSGGGSTSGSGPGFDGGTYGAGGSGGRGNGNAGGAGKQGIIVITYTPSGGGGSGITDRGFAISTDSALVTNVSTSSLGAQSATGGFSATVTGLSPNTTYFYRAFATNSNGTSYSSIVSVTTGSATPARKMRLFEGFRIKLLNGRIKMHGQ